MNIFGSGEDALVEKADGSVVGPYKMKFAGTVILISNIKADVQEGDVIVRKLPSGKDERSHVTEATLYQGMGGLPAHYQIKFRKGNISSQPSPSHHINIHGANSVQIGNHNTQNIISSIQALASQIESSNASPEQKNEARSLLQKFLSHPLLVTLLGAAAGSILP